MNNTTVGLGERGAAVRVRKPFPVADFRGRAQRTTCVPIRRAPCNTFVLYQEWIENNRELERLVKEIAPAHCRHEQARTSWSDELERRDTRKLNSGARNIASRSPRSLIATATCSCLCVSSVIESIRIDRWALEVADVWRWRPRRAGSSWRSNRERGPCVRTDARRSARHLPDAARARGGAAGRSRRRDSGRGPCPWRVYGTRLVPAAGGTVAPAAAMAGSPPVAGQHPGSPLAGRARLADELRAEARRGDRHRGARQSAGWMNGRGRYGTAKPRRRKRTRSSSRSVERAGTRSAGGRLGVQAAGTEPHTAATNAAVWRVRVPVQELGP